MQDKFKVALTSLKSCLVNLPQSLTRSLAVKNVPAQKVVVVISHATTKSSFCGWSGHTSSNSKAIELDPAFARNLGLTEGSEVSIDIKIEPREADVIWVEPQTTDDWEIMELHASFLELNLINQIRAVSFSHPLTLYLNTHTKATIVVKKIEPELKAGEDFAKISEFAEIVVSPKVRTKMHSSTSKSKSVTSSIPKTRATERKRTVFLRTIIDINSKLVGFHAVLPAAVLRSNIGLVSYLSIQTVLPPSLQRSANEDMISPPLPPKAIGEKALEVSNKIVVHAHSSEDVPEGHVKVSSMVAFALGLDVGSRVKLAPASAPSKISSLTYHSTPELPAVKEIKIGGKKDLILTDAFKSKLSEIGDGPVSYGMRLPGFVVTTDRENEWGLIPPIDKISINKGSEIRVSGSSSMNLDVEPLKLKGTQVSEVKIKKTLIRSGGVLLYGSRGCGKTALAKVCMQEAQKAYFHVVVADCAKVSEERVPSIKEAMNHWFATAAWYEPSVILLDDLDRLCPAEVEHADSTRARQVAEIFLSILRQYTSRHPISVLATSQSKESLHTLLTTSHIFDETISLKPPDKTARKEILHSLSDMNDETGVDWLEVANLTEGYLGGDLAFLTERAKHEGLMRQMLSGDKEQEVVDSQLMTIDYQKALTGFTPASLRGIKLQKSTVAWKDIGGLEETRRILLETLEWPTRYAPIFANCPLRLRSGLLLYGYPGCGKTLLASAVASECGLNFISVKGPEILNKYIGASEKSVRDLFDRAQAAKPCVLFFDEFDSIAPKRGHDSTGVTDRVVNQMLTQMDGAEGLDGVYVLAATSRPDLIDPALLRPGRLDKSLLCNMPDTADRASILEALAQKMHFSSDVNLADLAAQTDGFTGADLQAVLYNAHLEAIHDVLAQQEEEEAQLSSSQTLVPGTGSSGKEPTTFTQFKLAEKLSKTNGVLTPAATTPTDTGRAETTTMPKTLAELAAATARVEAVLAASRAHHNRSKNNNNNNTRLRDSSTSSVPSAGNSKSDLPSHDTATPLIAIRARNLRASLDSTKPSISAAERNRLDRVYREFVDGRSPDGLRDGTVPPNEQRATLA